jgi:hypothetical protein
MTDADLLLDLAARHYAYAGARDQAILDEAGMSPTRFWQRVNVLIDDPATCQAHPVVTARLRRQRQARQRSRAARAG